MDSINNGKTEDKITNTMSKGETKGKILDTYKKYVQVVILAEYLLVLLLLSNGKDP